MKLGGFSIAAAVVAVVAGCSFDTGGTGSAGAPDSGIAVVPDAAPFGGAADARPDRPDAEPAPDPAGVARSPRGTPDLFDESFEDWADAPVYSFDMTSAADMHPVSGYTPSARLTFASMHDDEYIYFALIVEDDTVLDAQHPLWNDDSISVYLDAAGDRSGPLGDDDHEVVIGSNGTYLDYAPGPNDAELDGTRIQTVDGYALEIGVRKDSLGNPSLPGTLGFNIAINDDDDGGSAAFGLWHVEIAPRCSTCCTGLDHAEPWCDTTTLGSLILE